MPAELTAFHYIFLPLLGFMAGASATLIGVGGGFIIMPVLLVLFPDSSPATLTSISLTVVLLNVSSGTVGYLKAHRVDIRTGSLLAATAIPAAVAGALATQGISRQHFEVVFGLALVIGAVYIFWRGTKVAPSGPSKPQASNRLLRDRTGASYSYHVNEPLAVLISPSAGFVSSFLGIGGGIIEVPAMILWLRVPPAIATATSHFVVVFTALTAVLVHISSGQYQHGFRRAGLLGAGALLGAQVGVYFAGRVNPRVILVLLSLGLAAAGVRQLAAGVA